MPWVNDEQIARAREVDLLSYLQASEPGELVETKYSGEYRTASHGSLVISNGKWVWNRGKALVKAAGEVLCVEAQYQGAPGFEFRVGDYTIDRRGVITADEDVAADAFGYLLNELSARGFVCEDSDLGDAPGAEHGGYGASDDDLTKREAIPDGGDGEGGDPSGEEETREAVSAEADGGSGKLCVNLPLFGITASSIDNLEKLVAAKGWILRKMAGTDALPIERTGKYLRFPWFRRESSPAEVDAYSRLIARLGETVKEKKRITATEKQMEDGDNEKFKARCFLLSLGFIGPEYAQARKILLSVFSGNGSHKAGAGKKAAPSGSTAADCGTETPEASVVQEGGSGANSADTGAENGDRRNCLACGHSISGPAETEGGADRLFCVVTQTYVSGDACCDEFNR